MQDVRPHFCSPEKPASQQDTPVRVSGAFVLCVPVSTHPDGQTHVQAAHGQADNGSYRCADAGPLTHI